MGSLVEPNRINVERPDSPQVTIVVPTIREPDRLRRCLQSALAVGRADDVAVELVLVLDGADEAVHRFVVGNVEGAIVVAWPERRGFAAALNAGFRAASAAFVAVLQDDSEVQPRWLASLLATANRYPRAGVVGSVVLWPDRSLQTAGSIIGGDGVTSPPWVGNPPDPETIAEVRAVDYVSSSSVLVRRDAWEEVGGFDEEMYPSLYVDADFCTALWNAGRSVVVDPGSVIVHNRSGSTSNLLKELVGQRNRMRFLEKWAVFVGGRPPWLTTPPTESEIATEQCRAAAWLDNPPPVTLHPKDGAPAETSVGEYQRRERMLLRDYVEFLEARVEALSAHREAVMADRDTLAGSLHDTKASLAATIRELNQTRQTVSWRVTAPLRVVRKWCADAIGRRARRT